MRAESLELAALFLAVTILLTTTLTKLVITFPETFMRRTVVTGGNPALRTPIALLLVCTFISLIYLLGKEKYVRYLFAGTSKRRTWIDYLAWLVLLLAAYYFAKSPETAKSVSNNTSLISLPPVEEISRSTTPASNETMPIPSSSSGWSSILNALPILAVAILIAIYLSSEKLAEIVAPKRMEVKKLLDFVEISGNPREAIIRAYRNAIVFLTRKGLPYREAWTHREHEAFVVPKLGESAINLSSLASLFEIAKYSKKKVNKHDVSTAIEYYERLTRGMKDGRT